MKDMRKGFTKIPNTVLDQPWANNPVVVYLYTWLSLNADKDGCLSLSLNEITALTRLNKMQVRRALEKLKATEYVTQIVTQPATQKATHLPNKLSVCFLSGYKSEKCDTDTTSDTTSDTISDTLPRAYKNDNINIMSIENNKEEKEILSNESTKKGDESPTRATDDLELRYKKWMDENFPLVQKMQKPLTFKQYQKIIEDGYTVDEITSELEDMENWSKLKTKTTANLTLRNWLKKDYGKRNYTTQRPG